MAVHGGPGRNVIKAAGVGTKGTASTSRHAGQASVPGAKPPKY